MHVLTGKSWLLAATLSLLAMPAWAVDHRVRLGGSFGLTYSPASLTINAGDTVTFQNLGGFHNVVSDTGAFRCARGCDGAGGDGNPTDFNFSVTVAFNTPGSFGYFCNVHGSPGAGMFGRITVQGTAPPPPPPPLSAGYTGAWYNPMQDGHGFFVEILPGNVMVAAWYIFTPEGAQSWIVGSGPVTGNTAALDGFIASGGRFLPNFNPAQIVRTPWGRMNFTFTNCNTGRMDYVSTVTGYGSGTVPLTRLTLPAGSACAPPAALESTQ